MKQFFIDRDDTTEEMLEWVNEYGTVDDMRFPFGISRNLPKVVGLFIPDEHLVFFVLKFGAKVY